MKKLIFCLAAFIFLLSSCGDDDKLSDTIIGVWKLQTFSITDCADPMDNIGVVDADSDGCITVQGVTLCDQVEFMTDGSVVNSSSFNGTPDTTILSYTVNNDANQVTVCDGPSDCETFTITNNMLTRSDLEDECTYSSVYSK